MFGGGKVENKEAVCAIKLSMLFDGIEVSKENILSLTLINFHSLYSLLL